MRQRLWLASVALAFGVIQMWRAIGRLATVLLSILVAIGLAEGALRVFWPVECSQPPRRGAVLPQLYQTSQVPALVYELKPNVATTYRGVTVRTNRLGLRGSDPVTPKPDSLLRFAILGDSFTFGHAVQQELIFPVVLERLLNERSIDDSLRYEVLNFGVDGYSIRDYVSVLEHKALDLDPDLIIVTYFLNDPEIDRVQRLHRYFREVAWWERWHTGRLLMRAANNVETNRHARGDYYHVLHADAGKWRAVEDGLRAIRALTESRGVPALVMVLPEPPDNDDWSHYKYADLHEKVVQAARDAGLDAFDTLGFLESSRPRRLRISPVDFHLSETGHQLLARLLHAWIVSHPEILGTDDPPWNEEERSAAARLLDTASGDGSTIP